MTTPKVSIILPTYNGARYLRESIDSCLTQTYPNVELIAVDDCSTDDTPRILSEYAADSRVKIIRHAVNSKLPSALNTGFANATGTYLTWTSDDNRFAPHALDELTRYLEEHRYVGFVYSDYWLIDEKGETIRRVEAGPPEHLRERCAITSFLYRREVYEQVGDYDPALFRIEDYEYWLRISQRFALAWYPEPLYYYRRHPSSLTSADQLDNRARMFDEVQNKYFGRDPWRQTRVLAQFLIAEAFECYLRRDPSGVRRHAFRAIRLNPLLLRNRGVLSIIAQSVIGMVALQRFRQSSRYVQPG
jgi:glycosyltransferase involved in cell wall biosynthesis